MTVLARRALQSWGGMATISRMKKPALTLLVALFPLTLACGDGGKGATPAARVSQGRCGMPGDSTIAVAVTQFVKQVTPTPQRFLATVLASSLFRRATTVLLTHGIHQLSIEYL